MADKILAATQTGVRQMEMREYDFPELPPDAALLKVESAGICGADVPAFNRDPGDGRILGHENVGYVTHLGPAAARRWNLKEGDMIAVEEYLPCYYCEWCHKGEYRHCWATDILNNPGAPRYGFTSVALAPGLWGGYSQYLYLPHNAVWHHIPKGVTADEAVLAIAMSNGVQWATIDGGVGPGKSILIQGAGQMGQGCIVAAKQAGADLIIVSGLSRDNWRLDVAKKMGADYTIEVDKEDVRERVREITAGKGVDVAVDCTSHTAGLEPTLVALDVLRTRGGTAVIQGMGITAPEFPLYKLAQKYITVKVCRGHCFDAVERALEIIASRRFPLELMRTHHFGLKEADKGILATGGEGVPNAIHVTINPWAELHA